MCRSKTPAKQLVRSGQKGRPHNKWLSLVPEAFYRRRFEFVQLKASLYRHRSLTKPLTDTQKRTLVPSNRALCYCLHLSRFVCPLRCDVFPPTNTQHHQRGRVLAALVAYSTTTTKNPLTMVALLFVCLSLLLFSLLTPLTERLFI